MGRVLAVANQKGGVAKTTTVASLGVALHELGRRVLLIDLDPQACLTFSLGHDPDRVDLSIHDVLLGRVSPGMAIVPTADGPDLLPSTIDLAGGEVTLLSRTGREHALRLALEDTVDAYDDILLDCPPSLGVLTINGLTASDGVLVPLQCETLSHRGVGQLLETVHDVQRLTNRGLRVLGVLPTLYDGRTNHAREVLADVSGRYAMTVLDPPIAKSVRFAEAPATGRSALSTAGRTAGALAYREHARKLCGLPVDPIQVSEGRGGEPDLTPSDRSTRNRKTGSRNARPRAAGNQAAGDHSRGDVDLTDVAVDGGPPAGVGVNEVVSA
ncbi:MAG: ParA family protein [Frankiaceae bacterium]